MGIQHGDGDSGGGDDDGAEHVVVVPPRVHCHVAITLVFVRPHVLPREGYMRIVFVQVPSRCRATSIKSSPPSWLRHVTSIT